MRIKQWVLFVVLMLCVALAWALDINKASQSELTELKGVGAKKAAAIVQYRTEHGTFKTAQDILNVKGIGPKILKQNAQTLTIDGKPIAVDGLGKVQKKSGTKAKGANQGSSKGTTKTQDTQSAPSNTSAKPSSSGTGGTQSTPAKPSN